MTMHTPPILLADRIARAVFCTLAALPDRIQRALGGSPIHIDGQQLHPTAQLGLRLLNLVAGETFETKPLAEGRAELAHEAWVFGKASPVGSVRDFSLDGPNGPVPVRLYRPVNAPPNTPLLVYYHGGGWVLGGLESADSVVRFLVAQTGVSVLSVDYRLAPEHRFPAGLEDSLAAFDFAVAHASDFGCDPRLVGVAGESAGGNLAAVVSLVTTQRARTEATQAVPAFQMLFQPVTDLSKKHLSYSLFRSGFFLTEAQMDWYSSHYLGSATEALDPKVSPLLAPDLGGLPPAYVVVAGFDPLRDEGEAYAARLEQAGVPVVLRRFSGVTHGFINATGVGSVAREMLLEVSGVLSALIGLARSRKAPSHLPLQPVLGHSERQ